ncbi:ATP12-domain-containing protein [Tothia fuscella]|uniref:ATP12-domain-containing protein n=1 Tax=Tothia fuscella TaxID=1048955 RepID=A0A9P4NT18_9PEZI|nr:ATP12-domain-containing protein [Tothia fuscella]
MEALRPLTNVSVRRLLQRPPKSICRYQCLHTTTAKPATPLPFHTAPAPPPPAPVPQLSTPEERLQRKRKNAELLKRGQELKANRAKPAGVLRKRFWKDVTVKETSEGHHQIYLDTRPVRTSNKEILTVPKGKKDLATAIALEWDQLVSAYQATKYHYIPLTSLINRALDIEEADKAGKTKIRNDLVAMLMRYLTTDTLLCWVPEKDIHTPPSLKDGQEQWQGESLRTRQKRTAVPIIDHLASSVWPGVEIVPVLSDDSIMPISQSPMTQEVIKGWISGLPAYELAGLERGVLATKSLLVATRLLVDWSQEFADMREQDADAEKFGIEHAAEACSVEVRWQTDMWGEVEDTHDVEKEDLRRQLGGVVLLVGGDV